MSTPIKMAIFALSALVTVAGVWLINQASGDTNNGNRLKGTEICVPEEYAVSLTTSWESQADSFDTEDGYGLSVSIDSKEVSQNIDGYRKMIEVNGHRQHEDIYLSLHPAPQDSLTVEVEDPKTLTAIDKAPDLFIKDFDPTPLALLEVIEKDGDSYKKWGYCSRFTSERDNMIMECDRDFLRVGPLRIKHEIDEAQLHLHNEIDQFIKGKIGQWHCP